MSGSGISRREFITAVAGTVASSCLTLPSPARAAVSRRPALSLPLTSLKPSYDVVVVGSGYGGSVMAARLAAGRSLCVLERGKEWQPADFPSNPVEAVAALRNPAAPLGLLDYHAGLDLDVLVGCGLGGTSLINANVVIAPDRDIFAAWPAAIRDAYASGGMNTYEQRVRQMLAAEAVTEQTGLRKNWLHTSTTKRRQRAGKKVQANNAAIAVNLTRYNETPNAQGVMQSLCAHCGDCVSGCRFGAKNTLDANYLPLAKQRGAEIFSRVEVDHLERLSDGRWRVHYVARPDGALPHGGSIVANTVILGAGALGTPQILLRSRAQGLPLSDKLGTRFSSNGDLLGFGYNGDIQANVLGFGKGVPSMGEQKVGPTITTIADYRGAPTVSERYLIEEGAIPSVLVDVLRPLLPALAGIPPSPPHADRISRDLLRTEARGAFNHSMLYLGIGHDSAGGRLSLDPLGNVAVSWPGILQEPFVARIRDEMKRHAATFDGLYLDFPRQWPILAGGALVTVHPLGGCPMADSIDAGVVNANGQVYDPGAGKTGVYAGLYAMDGSILPGSVGANPLLTIASLAERAAERFV